MLDISDQYCHTSTIEVRCSAAKALAYLSDGIKQGDWTLGSLDRKEIEDGLFAGTSLFDLGRMYIRIRVDRENFMIYYDVGRDPEKLQPRNIVRVVPGSVVGHDDDICLVSLMTWRVDGTPEAGWLQTCLSHETEMFIIKARLEENIA